MLVDTSVWIDYLRAAESPHTALLDQALLEESPVFLTTSILQEVLQGARSRREFGELQEYFAVLPLLGLEDSRGLAERAALLYLNCRRRGITPRHHVDCLIAQIAIDYQQPLLHADRDFASIARAEPKLRVVELD